jgi:hypothetical protein
LFGGVQKSFSYKGGNRRNRRNRRSRSHNGRISEHSLHFKILLYSPVRISCCLSPLLEGKYEWCPIPDSHSIWKAWIEADYRYPLGRRFMIQFLLSIGPGLCKFASRHIAEATISLWPAWELGVHHDITLTAALSFGKCQRGNNHLNRRALTYEGAEYYRISPLLCVKDGKIAGESGSCHFIASGVGVSWYM